MIRFNEDWLRSPEMCEWLVRVSNDESRAYCRWCAIILRAHKSDLMTHSTTAKHAKNSSLAGTPTGPLNVQIVTSDDQSQIQDDKKQAELSLRNSLTPRTQYAKKYRLEWETMDELKDWLQPLPEDPSKAYCRVCHVQLRAHKHDLVLHGKSVKHKTASETMGGDNFITVAFGNTIESDGSIMLEPHSPPEKKLKSSNDNEETQEIIDADNSNAMDSSMCEDTEILVGARQDEELEDKKPGEISIIRVPASNNRTIMRASGGRKRRMVVSEVLTAIAMNEFTGYELLQIVKAAVPKL